jgi:putative hydrolase of the HAD superfamily
MARMIAAVLFDLDGVVRRWDPSITDLAEQRRGLPAGSILRTAFEPVLLAAAVTGAIDDATWRAAVADTLAAEHGEAARLAVQEWSAPAGAVDTEVLQVLRAERSRRRVALLSNATTRLEADLAALGLDREVDAVLGSARLGHAKPDAAAFHAACAALDLRPDECAFVDDSQVNVEAARRLGLRAHAFRGVDGLVRFLEALPRNR